MEWLPVTGTLKPARFAVDASYLLDGLGLPDSRLYFTPTDPGAAVTIANLADDVRYLLMPIGLRPEEVLPVATEDSANAAATTDGAATGVEPSPSEADAPAPAPQEPAHNPTAPAPGGWMGPAVCWVQRRAAVAWLADVLVNAAGKRETPTYWAFDAARLSAADADALARAFGALADAALGKRLTARWAACRAARLAPGLGHVA
jgi:hypothetical protein